MLTTEERRAKYAKTQEVFRFRQRNLRSVIDLTGGWHQGSRATGKSIQLLKQCCGDNPCRSIGDTLARELEHTLRLPLNYLDSPPARFL